LTALFNQQLFNKVLLAMLVLTIVRVVSVFFSPYSLQVDEAQYAGWSHDLAAGYYSKPPFIAWILRLGQETCSTLQLHNIEGCTRMLQAPALLITTLLVMASTWQLFGSNKIMLFSGLIFITLPLVGFYSLVATTDTWLLMWWSLALLTYILAINNPSAWWPWSLCGVSVGLGILTKYTMLVFVVSVAMHMIQADLYKQKQLLIKPVFSLLIAFILFLPNIVWNVQTGFPTFEHHLEISHVTSVAGSWALPHGIYELFSFFFAQFIVFGPLAFFTLLIVSFVKNDALKIPEADAKSIQLLLMFIWPMLGLMLVQALMSRAFGNWAVVAYIAGAILIAAFWGRQLESIQNNSLFRGKRAVQMTVFLGLILSVLMMVIPHWTHSTSELQTAHMNPLRKLLGWKDVALWAKVRLQSRPMRVIAEDRYLLAELSVYGYPEAYPPLSWNPTKLKSNHYRWFYDLADARIAPQQTMLLILIRHPTQSLLADLSDSFDSVVQVQDSTLHSLKVGGDQLQVYVFEVRGFKGYQQ
jgi:4-amino-4-deoxy-L-arabinose transferase-like glycosyltransferase